MTEHCKERYQKADSNRKLTWCCTHLPFDFIDCHGRLLLTRCLMEQKHCRALVFPSFSGNPMFCVGNYSPLDALWFVCSKSHFSLTFSLSTSWTSLASGNGGLAFSLTGDKSFGMSILRGHIKAHLSPGGRILCSQWRATEDSCCLLSAFSTDNVSSLTKACHRFYAKSIVSFFF